MRIIWGICKIMNIQLFKCSVPRVDCRTPTVFYRMMWNLTATVVVMRLENIISFHFKQLFLLFYCLDWTECLCSSNSRHFQKFQLDDSFSILAAVSESVLEVRIRPLNRLRKNNGADEALVYNRVRTNDDGKAMLQHLMKVFFCSYRIAVFHRATIDG